MAGFYPITIDVDGRTVRGEWTHKMGGRICVRSHGYGSLTIPLGKRNPPEFARRVLAIIVRCYYRRQAAEWARQEREAARLGGRTRRRSELRP